MKTSTCHPFWINVSWSSRHYVKPIKKKCDTNAKLEVVAINRFAIDSWKHCIVLVPKPKRMLRSRDMVHFHCTLRMRPAHQNTNRILISYGFCILKNLCSLNFHGHGSCSMCKAALSRNLPY